MKPMRLVLLAGAVNIPDAPNKLPSERDNRFTTAKAFTELVAMTAKHICAALPDHSLSSNELARCAQAVRWRWPSARTVLLRADDPHIDDGLCGERLEPVLAPKQLLVSIDRIIESQQPVRDRVRLWEH